MKRLTILFAFLTFFILPKEDVFAFSDVQKKDYFSDAVQWASEEGIISGYEDGSFRPHRPVTHRQFIKMYTNTFDFQQTATSNSDDYYDTLEEYGIQFDYTNFTNPILRGDVAVLIAYANGEIHRPTSFSSYYTKNHYEQAAQFMLDTKVSTGQNNSTKNNASTIFGTNNSLTRAQAITFLYRLYQYDLNTLADAVKLYKEPFLFPENVDVLRSYDVGKDITYHVITDAEDYSLAITYKNYLIGGYETEVGYELFGYTIGYDQLEKDDSNTYFGSSNFPKEGIHINRHADHHDQNIIRAISWWVGTPSVADQVQYAKSLATSTHTTSIATIYRDLANEFRAKAGLHLLEEHWALTTAAKAHSMDMATRNYFSHTTPEGLSPSDRVKLVRNNTEILSAGENISAGYSSIFESHTGLINSWGHRTNLLNSSYHYIGYGIGYNGNSQYERYYTTKFSF